MRHLILIRHAKSDYPLGVADHDRPLAERGRRDAPQIGRHLAALPWMPDSTSLRILVSSAVRAQQTWLAAAGELEGTPWEVPCLTESRIYEAAPSTLRAVIDDHSAADTVVVVGHNPGLVQLVAELGTPSVTRSQALEKFPTSSVAVIVRGNDDPGIVDALGAFEVSSFGIPRG